MFYKKNYKNVIDAFVGDYAFLSNFYPCTVTYNGLTYQNTEAAFQAQKVLTDEERQEFTSLTASEAKRLGRHVDLRKDWEKVKLMEMFNIVYAKFKQHPELAKKLAETDDCYLEEGNWWHDNFWGVCNGEGLNELGKILMTIRNEFRE